MAVVSARIGGLLVLLVVFSHLSTRIVANHVYYRYYEYHVFEVRLFQGEFYNPEDLNFYSDWLFFWILCRKPEHGNRNMRRRMTLAFLRKKRRCHRLQMMTSFSYLPSFCSRPQLHKMITRFSVKMVLPSEPSFLELLLTVSLLLLCGDVEQNPGPHQPATTHLIHSADHCLLCDKAGRKNQRRVKCACCNRVYHLKCLKLNKIELNVLSNYQYKCWQCSQPSLNDSFFNTSDEIDDFQDISTRKDCNSSGISMLSFNARSLKDPKKKHLFISWLQTMDPSIVAVNETWFNDQIKSSELFREDYIVFRKDRANGKGEGVLLAIKSHFAPKRLLNIENNSELLWVEITNKHKKILISSAYRSPSNKDIDNYELIDSLNMASAISDKYHACLVTGDFNLQIDWLGVAPRPLNTMSELLLSCFYYFVPNQLVSGPTRNVGNSTNTLDLFLCNNMDVIKAVEVIPGISDHDAIWASLHLSFPVSSTQKRLIYNYNRADWAGLCQLFRDRLPLNFNGLDIDGAWNLWMKTFFECVEICIPKVTLKLRKIHQCVSGDVKSVIRRKNRLFRFWKKKINRLLMLH
jgi:hypothetical protein